VSRLKDRLRKKNKTIRNLKSKNSTTTSNILSVQQSRKLSGRLPRWMTEDIVKALTLRSISLKAYETMRLVWKFPLPGLTTLRSWAKNFSCPPGILSDVLEVLKIQMQNRDMMYRLAVLMFDEMGLDSRYSRDQTFDVVESHSKVQV